MTEAPATSYRRSSLLLVLVNLLPIVGVLLSNWSVLHVLLLYWSESVIIGLINVLRMTRCQPDNLMVGIRDELPAAGRSDIPEFKLPQNAASTIKLFIIPFFAVHYGLFCFGHLMAVLGIFSGDRGAVAADVLLTAPFVIAVAAIAASHLFSYFNNFIGKEEYRHTGLVALMQRPYGRIVVMHLTIILGAGLVMWLGDPMPMLLALIIVKTGIDLKLHRKERRKFATESSAVFAV